MICGSAEADHYCDGSKNRLPRCIWHVMPVQQLAYPCIQPYHVSFVF